MSVQVQSDGTQILPHPRGVFSRTGRARHSWTFDINEASRVGRLWRLELAERIREALAVPSRSGIRAIAKAVRCIADELQNVARQTPYNMFRVFEGRAVLTLAMIKDMLWATCISISVVSAVNVLLWVWGAL